MRDYQKTINNYRISKGAYKKAQVFIAEYIAGAFGTAYHTHELTDFMDDVLTAATEGMPGLRQYLYAYLVDSERTVASLVEEGMPCSESTFRVLRYRFFYILSNALKNGAL